MDMEVDVAELDELDVTVAVDVVELVLALDVVDVVQLLHKFGQRSVMTVPNSDASGLHWARRKAWQPSISAPPLQRVVVDVDVVDVVHFPHSAGQSIDTNGNMQFLTSTSL